MESLARLLGMSGLSLSLLLASAVDDAWMTPFLLGEPSAAIGFHWLIAAAQLAALMAFVFAGTERWAFALTAAVSGGCLLLLSINGVSALLLLGLNSDTVGQQVMLLLFLLAQLTVLLAVGRFLFKTRTR